MAAARELMADGKEVTLAKVAERAKTSRATIYRYFSDPGVLALDATLDSEIRTTSDLLQGTTDVRQRVQIVAQYYLEFSRDHEAYFRQFLAKSLLAALNDKSAKMRGARRVAAFAEALEPVRTSLDPGDFDDLTKRLSMTTGMEQFVVLEDILRVNQQDAERLQMGLVDALLDRYLPADV